MGAKSALKRLHKGQEFVSRMTDKVMHSVKIKSVGKDKVTADIKLSPASQLPTVNLISMTFQFNDVVLAKHFVRELAIAAETNTKKGKATDISDRVLLGAMIFAVAQQDVMYGMLNDKDSMARTLAGIAFLGDKSKVRPKLDVDFKIKSENEKEIVFEITKGVYRGKTVKLDRKMDINIEFLFEKAGYFTMPARIENMSDDKANPYLMPRLDCSRDVQMEIFMSEHAGGRHPACTVQTSTVRKGDKLGTLGTVTAIDSKGVVFDKAGRLDYGKERTIGEFLVTLTLRADKGTKPGTAKITKIGTEFGQSE